MADRRQPFFRFWGRPRRTPDAQTLPPPPAAQAPPPAAQVPLPPPPAAQMPPPPDATNSGQLTKPAVESQPTIATSTTTPTNETQTPPPPTTTPSPNSATNFEAPPAKTTSNSPPNPTLQPVRSQAQTDHPLTNTLDEPKTPSQTTETKSRSSSKPPSPTPRTPQSRSPPHPLSQSRSTTSTSLSGNSKPPFTPQRASQPRSPSLSTSSTPRKTTSNSPKERNLGSPSIKSRQMAQEASSSSEGRSIAPKDKNPKPVTSQQEPQLKEKVESASVDNKINSVEETKPKHNEVKEMPSKINGDQKSLEELKAKPEDIKDVKEVTQATKVQANEVTKKNVSPSLNPKLGFEEPIIGNSKTPSKPEEVHTEKPKSTSPIAHDKSTSKIGQHVPLKKDTRDEIPTFTTQMAMQDPKNAIDDRNVSIITLAGENRGASMQMGSTPKEGAIHIHRGYKLKPDESPETTTDGEGSSRLKQSEDGKVTEDQPKEACVNNNAQGINNSIVFNSSIAEGSPGVHMVVTHVPKEPVWPAEGMNPLETRKAEFNMSRAEKHVYEPTVRRRCLRGLLLETSDSDMENPEKPRRHGCRVGCETKNKEKGIDVV